MASSNWGEQILIREAESQAHPCSFLDAVWSLCETVIKNETGK